VTSSEGQGETDDETMATWETVERRVDEEGLWSGRSH
jgi:hypothetical protein